MRYQSQYHIYHQLQQQHHHHRHYRYRNYPYQRNTDDHQRQGRQVTRCIQRACKYLLVALFVFMGRPAVSASDYISSEGIVAEFQNPFAFSGELNTGSTTNGQENQEMPFEKMVIDRSTDRPYVGGVNYLYDLYANLTVRKFVKTGPKEDLSECPSKSSCGLRNSYTKALAVYERNAKLIECSSLFQGRCRWRNLNDIDQKDAIKDSQRALVAHDQSSSTVIFIGTGKAEDNSTSDVLYLASTYVEGVGLLRDDVASVASLSLEQDRLFDVFVKSVGTGTEVRLERQYRDVYKIEYIGGFQSGRFAYFATRQPKEYNTQNPSPIISKLIRICIEDAHFWSYTEMPLSCLHDSEEYNLVEDVYFSKPGFDFASSLNIDVDDDVIYAVFVKGLGPEKAVPSSQSALCFYTMSAIENEFKKTIEQCFRGEGSKNLPWYKSAGNCSRTQFDPRDILCGKDVNSHIGGITPIKANAIFVTKDAQFTAVATKTDRRSTVAFIGTHDGRLLKAVLVNRTSAFVYHTLELRDGKPILRDLELDGSGSHVYVLTPNKVAKVKVNQCSAAGDCKSCLAQHDPFCGWCILTNRCVPEDDCLVPTTPGWPTAADWPTAPDWPTTRDWLTFQNGRCPAIHSVKPDKVNVGSDLFLEIELENTPKLEGRWMCVFEFDGAYGSSTTDVQLSRENLIRCPIPPLDRLPRITSGEQSYIARLAVSKRAEDVSLAYANITFYDCTRYQYCSSCVSTYPCDWCLESNQCVASSATENKCRSQTIINGVQDGGSSRRRGPEYCPRIVADKNDFYIAYGKNQKIVVNVKNIMSFMEDFTCLFKIEHALHERLARIKGESIICNYTNYDYDDRVFSKGTAVANFSVVWSSKEQTGRHILDNDQNIRVIMYKCEHLATNCGLCLGLSGENYDCGWCSNEEMCTLHENCRVSSSMEWLDRSQLCPSPRIRDFFPKKGPIAGGTLLTVDGENLGTRYQGVSRAVTAANVRCHVDDNLSETATRIVCRTGPVPGRKVVYGLVTVKLREDFKYTANSDIVFTYVDPILTRIEPNKGPQSGGTDVTVWGQNLDVGSSVSVNIGDIPCIVMERSSENLVCRTGKSNTQSHGNLKINIDNFSQEYGEIRFKYENNPRLQSVSPELSILSGGIIVDVVGTGFKLLQRPHMIVLDKMESKEGPRCEIIRDDLMSCKTPNLTSFIGKQRYLTANRSFRVDYGFMLDGVRAEYTSQVSPSRIPQLTVYPDPIVEKFNDIRFYRPYDYLTINVKELTLAAKERDVFATVGGEPCNLTAFTNQFLTCQPPREKPFTGNQNSDPEVLVRIGGMSDRVGHLSYSTKSNEVSPQVTIAILISVLAILCAFILLSIFYRRKTTSHMREMKCLKNQIDQIEMKVAAECKEAFAELQTSMNALTANLPLGTPFIPFLYYEEYISRVLFPNNYKTHPVLRDLEVDSHRAQSIETGLRKFNRLLMNKQFLLSFVRALENNKYFMAKDRVAVGSLLMVVLMEKMEYCTGILKQLLKELIDRTVEKKFQPKILFRRSESIAERMLAAWYTFLMHRYVSECAGQRLYELYWAIKQQMEKGPQDAITLEARYSLSEEKLLRASFDFNELTVFIAVDQNPSGTVEYPVRVLDCDTITQVKEKCLDAKYRTTPYSGRPSASDLDLELLSACPRIILQDSDSTSKVEIGGWRKLNTLAHYKVPNNAKLALVPRQASLYNLSLLSERSERSTFSLPKQSPTLARPFGTNSSSQCKGLLSNVESNDKCYHLIKPSEHGPSDQQDKMVTEIYLTRLLTMKGTLQKFIQNLLEVIFSTSAPASAITPGLLVTVPPCIKYMFDFMDEQAHEHGIDDDEVIHAWKSNSLLLRFWVNLIRNPHFVFDIQKPTKLEGCLSVVAQTLMDACSTQEHQLTKDSPSSKLLFAKDIYQYRDWVDGYYAEIREMPSISDQDMNAILADESHCCFRDKFHIFSALNELYKYLEQYKEPLREELENNPSSRNQNLPQKFQEMLNTMEYMGDQFSNGGSSTMNNYAHRVYRGRPREDRV